MVLISLGKNTSPPINKSISPFRLCLFLILSKLFSEASYIKVKRGEKPFSDIYYIDLESNITDQIRAKQREIILSLSDDDGRMLDAVFEQMVEGPIPFAHLKNNYNERKNILWENTIRQGWVKLCNLLEISTSEMENILGMAHGGAIFALIDEAFETAANSHGTIAVALNMNITYISSPPMKSLLRAEAREISLTRRTASYLINVTDAQDQLVATCQALVYRKEEKLPFIEGR